MGQHWRTYARIVSILRDRIAMYHRDHPPPHFHARYGSQKAKFGIEELDIIEESLSPRARSMVREWATQHQDELRRAWRLASQSEPVFKINPLE